ncbi:hypothetical protein H4Q26_016074 [Puccinia striiformis f. sp. tritici PST-130]|nr:hypothetical protein H4Q26_016074 [Puccinia striiformis f. sp. tritici PST-130]
MFSYKISDLLHTATILLSLQTITNGQNHPSDLPKTVGHESTPIKEPESILRRSTSNAEITTTRSRSGKVCMHELWRLAVQVQGGIVLRRDGPEKAGKRRTQLLRLCTIGDRRTSSRILANDKLLYYGVLNFYLFIKEIMDEMDKNTGVVGRSPVILVMSEFLLSEAICNTSTDIKRHDRFVCRKLFLLMTAYSRIPRIYPDHCEYNQTATIRMT